MGGKSHSHITQNSKLKIMKKSKKIIKSKLQSTLSRESQNQENVNRSNEKIKTSKKIKMAKLKNSAALKDNSKRIKSKKHKKESKSMENNEKFI